MSLRVAIPFASARECIRTLFDPVLGSNMNSSQRSRLTSTVPAFVKAHGMMFGGKMDADLDASVDHITRPLPEDYAMRGPVWHERYFPSGWCTNEKINDDEEFSEQPRTSSVFHGMQDDILDTARRTIGRTCRAILKRFRDPSLTLRRLIRISAVLTMFAAHASAAEPVVNPWHMAKVISVGATAMSSLGASLASLQLDMAEPSEAGETWACAWLARCCGRWVRILNAGRGMFTGGAGGSSAHPHMEDGYVSDASNSSVGRRFSDAEGRRASSASDNRRPPHDEGRRNEAGNSGIDFADIAVGTAVQNVFSAQKARNIRRKIPKKEV
ncbi:hypothetical protein B0H66DRAFT_602312 [Apodospora peruviana]|uniref:Uncharacterized protein n=1 Tax=Apodospora peruviana TaxID=516989 RepID=A0AAE0ID35_9PEZI|nr:hypothetical protein B0H66DRAFT_602312 [Apodospora peruviana]